MKMAKAGFLYGSFTGLLWCVTLLIGSGAVIPNQTLASDEREARVLVEKARITFQSFMEDPNMEIFRDLLKKSRGLIIIPQALKGAFVFGVSGGSGVLMVRDKGAESWAGPAFYSAGGVSFGLQAGGEASEVVLLAMTDRGVSSFMSHSFKLGADTSIAVGPVGAGVSAATANLSADILSFSRSKGLYGGISLEGAMVAVQDKWNQAYYGKKVAPKDILIQQSVKNPHAGELIQALSSSAK